MCRHIMPPYSCVIEILADEAKGKSDVAVFYVHLVATSGGIDFPFQHQPVMILVFCIVIAVVVVEHFQQGCP